MFYVIVYGLATLGALAVTAAVERDRGNDSPAAFAGLVHRSPLQAVALLVFLTSLAGIPPLAGFVGKFALFSAAMAESTKGGSPGLTWLVGLAAIMSAISLYYYLSVLKQAFVRDGPDGGDAAAGTMSPAHVLAVAAAGRGAGRSRAVPRAAARSDHGGGCRNVGVAVAVTGGALGSDSIRVQVIPVVLDWLYSFFGLLFSLFFAGAA